MIRGQVPHRLNERRGSEQILPAAGYQRARAALGDHAQTEHIARSLETRAASHPDATPALPGTIVRILRARRYGDFPPLRLYYSVDEMAIRFLWIEHYDEMEP
jgi:hypothetical protein